MFNPLIDDFSKLTDNEVDEKVQELGKKYWQTRNPQMRDQIAVIYDMYRMEVQSRRALAYQKEAENNDNDLDSLININ